MNIIAILISALCGAALQWAVPILFGDDWGTMPDWKPPFAWIVLCFAVLGLVFTLVAVSR